MLYTLLVLVSGVYLGQEFAIIPSIRIITANILIYLRELQDPNNNQQIVENVPGWFDNIWNK